MTNLNRQAFRRTGFNRDNQTCVVPYCEADAEDAHHIIERSVWDGGGYVPDNGASVCSYHHKAAERNLIPPQAFWMWIGVLTPPLPETVNSMYINKWAESYSQPPWKQYRQRIKYPSTRHLPFSHIGDDDDTYFRSVKSFLDVPLVITHKLDGSNAMLIKDTDEPVRARNGSHADHESFDQLKQLYWECEIHEQLPENIQVFGEWMHEKHSIHYGCDCADHCEDQGPPLDTLARGRYADQRQAYFFVFGVYNTGYDLWLSWPSTVRIAESLGFPTSPVIKQSDREDEPLYTNEGQFYHDVNGLAESVVSEGGEGIVVRRKYPFHYDQFSDSVGKYVRRNHVKTGEKHWRSQDHPVNNIYLSD
jgi:hypothetical protein